MATNNLLTTTGAADNVGFELNTFQNSAWNAIGEARDALDQMALLKPVFPEGSAQAGVAVGNIQYNNPVASPIWDFTFNPPTWDISDPVLSEIVKTPVDDFTGTPPAQVSPNIPITPNIETPTPLKDAPTVTSVIIPEAPLLSAVQDPKEWSIALPTVPNIDIGSFYATKPGSNNLNIPSATFNWTEDPYTSNTLTQVIDQLSVYFQGNTGIPSAIWEMIWAKENNREDIIGLKQIEEINEEWSSRGFSLPQGVQIARTQEVYQNLQNSSVSRSRDIAIKEAELEIENLKFAMQQGIALENLRGSWYQATQSRLLESTKYAAELAVTVFNAEVGFYNTQVQMYLAEVQVYRAEIEAELSKLEVYKSELEGQKIIGELNKQQVQIYTAKVQALNLEIDRYNAVLQGVKTSVEVDAVRIDGYRSEVQAYSEKIKAINLQYEGYTTAMQGAKIEADIYSTNVNAFANTVQSYATKIDAESKNTDIDINVNKYKLDEYNMKIQGFIASLDAEVKNLQAQSTAFEADVKAYTSKIESEKANMEAQVAQYTADINLASQVTQVNIANAQTNAQNALAEAGIIQQGLSSIAQINGAYAGSALAAANISMSISDHASNSSADY